MRRYPHYITRSSEGRWPDLVICVDCVTRTEVKDIHRAIEEEKLKWWSAHTLHAHRGTYRLACCESGCTYHNWWKYLAAECDDHNNVWVVSYQCSRVWSLLGLWDQLESGHVQVMYPHKQMAARLSDKVRKVRQDSTDPLGTLSSGHLSQLRRGNEGLLVTEDIPSIATLFVGAGCSRITWIDTRNYGAECLSESMPGQDRAASIARWFVDYALLLRQHRLGAPRTTAGSQAYHGWRHGYYTGGVYCHVNAAATRIEVDSYHGGRCEAYTIGPISGTAYHVDVRSMYPAICSVARLPARLLYHADRFSSVEYGRLSCEHGCLAEVTVRTEQPDYPRSRDGITIWPTGSIRVSLAGPELADAVAHDRVVAWHGVCVYQLDFVLRGYANELYTARCAAEAGASKALAESIKKLLVSLPGKFAQHARHWANTPHVAPAMWWGQWYGTDDAGKPCRYRSLGGTVQRDTNMGLGGEANPAIASWVTSAGRMILLDAIRTAGWDEVYYCDTDSLILTERGYDRLTASGAIQPRTLGKWQVKEIITQGEILGIKHYVHNGAVCCAGMPRLTVEKANGRNVYWQRDSPSWQIRANAKPSATRRMVSRVFAAEYRHGVVGPDGRVTPHHIQEE